MSDNKLLKKISPNVIPKKRVVSIAAPAISRVTISSTGCNQDTTNRQRQRYSSSPSSSHFSTGALAAASPIPSSESSGRDWIPSGRITSARANAQIIHRNEYNCCPTYAAHLAIIHVNIPSTGISSSSQASSTMSIRSGCRRSEKSIVCDIRIP